MLAIPNCKEMEGIWVYNCRSVVNNYESDTEMNQITQQTESSQGDTILNQPMPGMVGNGNANKHKQIMHKRNNTKEYKRNKPSFNRIQYSNSIQQEDSIQSVSSASCIHA